MSMDKILVTISGIVIVYAIYWFFFGKKDEAVEVTGKVSILVKGGYKPDSLVIKKGVKTTLSITRKDPNNCLEEFILPDFKIKKYLPLNETVEIDITPDKVGTFGFHCGMNMYHGKIIVE